jgi:hypothetical protein
MQISIKGREFNVEIAGEWPGYVILLPLANGLDKTVPIATGETKAAAVNNAIKYLIALVEMEEENAGCTAKE